MIKCENCEFNINGLCQRFPPAFAVTPIGRKWAFPMVGAFEGFQGCGEGRQLFNLKLETVEIPRPGVTVTVKSERTGEEIEGVFPAEPDAFRVAEVLKGTLPEGYVSATAVNAVAKAQGLPPLVERQGGVKPKRSRRKK